MKKRMGIAQQLKSVQCPTISGVMGHSSPHKLVQMPPSSSLYPELPIRPSNIIPQLFSWPVWQCRQTLLITDLSILRPEGTRRTGGSLAGSFAQLILCHLDQIIIAVIRRSIYSDPDFPDGPDHRFLHRVSEARLLVPLRRRQQQGIRLVHKSTFTRAPRTNHSSLVSCRVKPTL